MAGPYICCVTPHNRLEPETIRAVFTQVYTGHIDHHFTRYNPDPVPGHNIVAAYKRLQAVFLAEPKYSHMFILENDIIPPPDALERLLAVDADITYAVYCFRRGTPVVNITHIDTTNTLTDNAAEWRRDFERGAVVPCTGLGFGCTLIRRHVLERFEMRSRFGGGDADTELAKDARAAGLVQRAHLGVVCGHKRPDGCVLWPTATRPFYRKVGVSAPRLAEVRALVAFGVWDEKGAPHILRPGPDTLKIDYEIAASMVAVGQAAYVTPVLNDVANP